MGAVVGGIAGAASSALSAFGRSNPTYEDSAAAGQYNRGATQAYQGLQDTVKSGSFADYQNMLAQYSANGGVPNKQAIGNAQQFTQNIFAPQQTALNQAFQQQLWGANQQAALSGRDVNDPLLRAKLAQEQTRQQQMLAAQQTSFGAQYANQLSQQSLGYAGQRAQNDIGAYNNLFQAGQQGLGAERQFGMQQAQLQSQQTSFAQRLGATLQGGIAGVGAGLMAGAGFGGGDSGASAGGAPSLGGFGGGSNPFGLSGFGNIFGSSGGAQGGSGAYSGGGSGAGQPQTINLGTFGPQMPPAQQQQSPFGPNSFQYK